MARAMGIAKYASNPLPRSVSAAWQSIWVVVCDLMEWLVWERENGRSKTSVNIKLDEKIVDLPLPLIQ